MKEFSLDIVICTYNNAALLSRTLEALSKQQVDSPWIEWKVLIVNNNCTDKTSETVTSLMQAAGYALRMVHETKQGLTHARVCGVQNTSGDWIAFVDDDCLLSEDWVEQAAQFASQHPECGAFGGRITLEWEKPPPAFVLNRRYAYAGKQLGDTAKRRSWLPGAGMIVRRKALVASGWLDKQLLEDRIGRRLVSGGDVEIGMRIARAHEVWYNPNCNLRHLIPTRRMTREYLRRMEFGLGASRHNVAALSWRRSYASWLLYSLVYGFGFSVFSAADSVREGVYSSGPIDLRLGLSPALGWWAAMFAMWRMKSSERSEILGAVLPTENASNPTLPKLSMSSN